jgi:hypothetical protein
MSSLPQSSAGVVRSSDTAAFYVAETFQEMHKRLARERAELARDRAEGTRNRNRCVNALLETFTAEGSPFTSAQLREFRATLFYLAEDARPFLDGICKRFSEPKEAEIKKAALLAIAVEAINYLISD